MPQETLRFFCYFTYTPNPSSHLISNRYYSTSSAHVIHKLQTPLCTVYNFFFVLFFSMWKQVDYLDFSMKKFSSPYFRNSSSPSLFPTCSSLDKYSVRHLFRAKKHDLIFAAWSSLISYARDQQTWCAKKIFGKNCRKKTCYHWWTLIPLRGRKRWRNWNLSWTFAHWFGKFGFLLWSNGLHFSVFVNIGTTIFWDPKLMGRVKLQEPNRIDSIAMQWIDQSIVHLSLGYNFNF